VKVLRKALAAAEDGSVVVIQVGFSTNLARLLESPADAASTLPGVELVAKKVRLLQLMAGAFEPIEGNAAFGEYNVMRDRSAARSAAAVDRR
jgi:inosine-uridine nucleoside N-ribohydrolase